jgi:hypothetical protein
LLELSHTWSHTDLSLYIDDGTIYAISATLKAMTELTQTKYESILTWLHNNGLQTDATKTKLMTFTHH